MNLGLRGRPALVTAASAGLGFATAAALAREGCRLAICSRDASRIRDAARKLEGGHPRGTAVAAYETDLGRQTDVEALLHRAASDLNGLEILICNAGGPPSGGLTALDEAQWRQAFDVTLMSVVRCIRHAVPYFKESGRGAVLIVASSSVKRPIEGLLLSNVFRPALQGLCKSVALELASEGIRVNCIAPGRIGTGRTDEIDRATAEREGKSFEDVRTRSIAGIPMKRLGTPEEFGAVAAFLCSDAASYMTGSTVLVDGGAVRCL